MAGMRLARQGHAAAISDDEACVEDPVSVVTLVGDTGFEPVTSRM